MTTRQLLGLSAAFVLAGAFAACADPAAAPNPDIVIQAGAVAQGSAGFAPNPLTKSLSAAGGARVTWLNEDVGTGHWLISDEGFFDAGNVAPDRAFSFTFPGAGTYHYHCLNHPAMVGTVRIVP